jgi:hypothetical protein
MRNPREIANPGSPVRRSLKALGWPKIGAEHDADMVHQALTIRREVATRQGWSSPTFAAVEQRHAQGGEGTPPGHEQIPPSVSSRAAPSSTTLLRVRASELARLGFLPDPANGMHAVFAGPLALANTPPDTLSGRPQYPVTRNHSRNSTETVTKTSPQGCSILRA